MILRGELADYLTTKEYVKPQEVNPRRVEAHKLRRLSSINTIASGSINIGFGDGDLSKVQLPHEDPLVISLLMTNCMIKRILIDPRSSADIITKAVFEQLEILSSSIRPTSRLLMGFDGTKVDPLGMIDLSVTMTKRTLKENFVLTEIHPSYDLIIGRGWIHRMNGVPSTLHQQLQNPLPRYLSAEEEAEAEKPTKDSLEAVEVILDNPQKITYLGSSPTAKEKEALINFVRRNADAFALEHSDMVGIYLSVSCHSLKVDPTYKPVKQKHRRFALERNQIIAKEKKNGKCRVCIDFTNLNKACPKDSFPLPKIDQMVDAITSFERLTFLDAYSGYNQIPMNPEDEEKTTFITEKGTYCYRVMPFRLKNVRATYQRLLTRSLMKCWERRLRPISMIWWFKV
ncbi:uncharacterized protein LOC132277670 [Cornus florida]|uniref:uncharacterized protein LOC132277670 n=1 Tax=Cornus florida TaxID=4283 RepID=UPI00289C7A3A|nr:uncharacterized protein LOC132277670 [Cornus florida]